MNGILSINSRSIRRILDAHQLGDATMLDDETGLRIFLEAEPAAVMAVHLATGELEGATGRVVQISRKGDMSPAQQDRLLRHGQKV